MKVETIIEQSLFSTVLIETTKPVGARTDTVTGTGFIFSYEDGSKQFLFLVTNKHVIANATAGRLFFTLGDDSKPFIGMRVDVVLPESPTLWHGHPDPSIDIAFTPFAQVLQQLTSGGYKPFFRSIPHSLTPGSISRRSGQGIKRI